MNSRQTLVAIVLAVAAGAAAAALVFVFLPGVRRSDTAPPAGSGPSQLGVVSTASPGGSSGAGRPSKTGRGSAASGSDIPVINAPERNTIAFFSEDFATGPVRYTVRLKVIGWQGDRAGRALVVRFTEASRSGGGTVKAPLDIKDNDYVVTVERPVKDRTALEGKTVIVEFRPVGGMYQVFLP